MDALGDDDERLALFLIHALDIGTEAFHIEIALGQINEVGAAALICSKCCRCRKPAGMTAHYLNDVDRAGAVNAGILIKFHAGCCDIFCRAAVAGAVIRSEQVVVDRLGNSDNSAIIADTAHVAAYLIAGVHRIVAAVIEEVANVILFENFKYALIIAVILLGLGYFIAA